tara:strand:- start:100 stop:492 length:393 start_codon:yes stop_codon:yes gene_type:complete
MRIDRLYCSNEHFTNDEGEDMTQEITNFGGRLLTVKASDFNTLDRWHNFLARAVPDLDPNKMASDKITLTVVAARYNQHEVNEKTVDFVLHDLKTSLQGTLDQQDANALELAATRALMAKAKREQDANAE